MENKDWLKNMLGGNGNGHKPELVTEMKDLDKGIQDIDRMLNSLLMQLDGHEMNAETASMVEGFGAHINRNALWRFLERRGSSYRITAPLGDAIIEFQGKGKLHLQLASLLADFIPLVSLKMLLSSVRLDKFQQVVEHTSDETQALMNQMTELHRKQLLQFSQKMVESFEADAMDRLNGSRGS